MLTSLLILSGLSTSALANWNEWWTYDGILGPAYWGLINPAWTMCNKVSQRKDCLLLLRDPDPGNIRLKLKY